MRREYPHLRLRIGPDVVRRVDALARRNQRTRNAQLAALVERALALAESEEAAPRFVPFSETTRPR